MVRGFSKYILDFNCCFRICWVVVSRFFFNLGLFLFLCDGDVDSERICFVDVKSSRVFGD